MGEEADSALENYWFSHGVFNEKRNKIPCWQTKDGQIIPISEMGTSHIRNCISLLERENRTNSRAYPTLVEELKKRK